MGLGRKGIHPNLRWGRGGGGGKGEVRGRGGGHTMGRVQGLGGALGRKGMGGGLGDGRRGGGGEKGGQEAVGGYG